MAQTSSADFKATVDAVKQLFYFPYSCASLVEAHAACVQSNPDWRLCKVAREAMDSCTTAGEQRRFKLEAKCMRFKRLHQSCLMHRSSDCEEELKRLHMCANQTLAEQVVAPSSGASSAS